MKPLRTGTRECRESQCVFNRPMMDQDIFAAREQYRDHYLRSRDPISEDRMLWRAQTFRHLMHLLPGQTILELGCGQATFTSQLARASRGENPITALTFISD